MNKTRLPLRILLPKKKIIKKRLVGVLRLSDDVITLIPDLGYDVTKVGSTIKNNNKESSFGQAIRFEKSMLFLQDFFAS